MNEKLISLDTLFELEDTIRLQRFRNTPEGKLCAIGRAKNEITIINTPNDLNGCINKSKCHIFILDESAVAHPFQSKEYEEYNKYLKQRLEKFKQSKSL